MEESSWTELNRVQWQVTKLVFFFYFMHTKYTSSKNFFLVCLNVYFTFFIILFTGFTSLSLNKYVFVYSTESSHKAQFPLAIQDFLLWCLMCVGRVHTRRTMLITIIISSFPVFPEEKIQITVFLCNAMMLQQQSTLLEFDIKFFFECTRTQTQQLLHVYIYVFHRVSQLDWVLFFIFGSSPLTRFWLKTKVEWEQHKVQLICFPPLYICCSNLCSYCRTSNSRTKYFHWNISAFKKIWKSMLEKKYVEQSM